MLVMPRLGHGKCTRRCEVLGEKQAFGSCPFQSPSLLSAGTADLGPGSLALSSRLCRHGCCRNGSGFQPVHAASG